MLASEDLLFAGCQDFGRISLWLWIHAGPQDCVCLCGYRHTTATDHLVQRRHWALRSFLSTCEYGTQQTLCSVGQRHQYTATFQPHYTASCSQTLVPTYQTTWCHIPKQWYLPTRLYNVTFPNTCTYQPYYMESFPNHWHLLSRPHSITFPNIFTYQPHYMLSYSLAPTIQAIYCHIPKHLHLPTMLQAVKFPDTGTYHPDYTVSYSWTLAPTIQTTWCHVPKQWKPSTTNFMT